MPAVLVTEPILLHRTRRFFPSGGGNHREYSVLTTPRRLPTEGWPGWVGPGAWLDWISRPYARKQSPISVL